MVTYLECTTPGHNKWWSIEIENETETVSKFGPIGKAGLVSHKDFPDAAKAKKFVETQIAHKKKKKGYVEAGGKEAPTADRGLDLGLYLGLDLGNSTEPPAKKQKTDAASAAGGGGTVRLEMKTGGHNKFWQIKVKGSKTHVEYGAICFGGIDAAPRTAEKTHANPAAAEKFKVGQIGKKKKEGYEEVVSAGGGAGPVAGAGKPPRMHVFGSRVSALELEKRRDDWSCANWEEDLCKDDVKHGTIDEAPEVAKSIAKELNDVMGEALGSGEFNVVQGSDATDGGEIIVISNPSSDIKAACLAALEIADGNKKACEKAAMIKKFDMKIGSYIHKMGFNFASEPNFADEVWSAEEQEEYLEQDEWLPKVLKGTHLMASKLTNFFVFGFNVNLVTAPVIYGGYASDGNIVGVLSSRVLT